MAPSTNLSSAVKYFQKFEIGTFSTMNETFSKNVLREWNESFSEKQNDKTYFESDIDI